MKPQVMISLHDVAPNHLRRLRQAEALFERFEVERVAYLLVPQFHGAHTAHRDADFVGFCRARRSFAVDWLLHGYYHLERPGAPDLSQETSPSGQSEVNPQGTSAETVPKAGWSEAFQRRFLTGGEGEFLALDEGEARRRIFAGKAVFEQCLGFAPEGFIAPAWLHAPGLFSWLRDWGFAYTEDHGHVHLLQDQKRLPSPVVTWATRTWLRRKGSLWVCPALEIQSRRAPLLRLALHPHDFDFPETVASISTVLGRVLRRRRAIGWREAG